MKYIIQFVIILVAVSAGVYVGMSLYSRQQPATESQVIALKHYAQSVKLDAGTINRIRLGLTNSEAASIREEIDHKVLNNSPASPHEIKRAIRLAKEVKMPQYSSEYFAIHNTHGEVENAISTLQQHTTLWKFLETTLTIVFPILVLIVLIVLLIDQLIISRRK